MKGMKFLLSILKYLFVLTIMVLSIGPFIWVFISSFKTNAEILNYSIGWPQSFKISNYLMAFKIAPLTQFYLNSVIVGIFGTILNLIILGMSAYVIARFDF